MKKNIALVYGGDSSEFEVSVKSASHVVQHIDSDRYVCYNVFLRGNDWRVFLPSQGVVVPEDIGSEGYSVDKSDFSFVIPSKDKTDTQRVTFDKVLIMIHGTPGENGLLQAYLELVGVPFVSSPASVSLLTFNKYACKCYMRGAGIKVPADVFLKKGDLYNSADIVAELGLPLFVKPNSGGSSFGAAKVKSVEDLGPAIEKAFKEDDYVLVEEYVAGKELTNGVYYRECEGSEEDCEEISVLPVTEIIPEGEYFDFAAKYEGASQEICPANISEELVDRVKELSLQIFRHLGCRGFARVDYIVCGEDIYFLEINTVPGMTEMSLVPQQVLAAGMSIKDFFSDLLG